MELENRFSSGVREVCVVGFENIPSGGACKVCALGFENSLISMWCG